VAAEVRWSALPLSEAAVAAAVVTGRDPARFVVAGGEDYELLLTARPDAVPQLRELAGQAGLTEIGSIVEGRPEVRFVTGDGSLVHPGVAGWDHFS
jgi:thiamine-monophosphate kinase